MKRLAARTFWQPFSTSTSRYVRSKPTVKKKKEESLKVRLQKLLHEEDYEDEEIRQKDRRRKEIKEKIRKSERFDEEKDQIVKQLEQYLNDIKNVVNDKPTFPTRHPAVYQYLGTSKAQLKNPYIVSDDVTKFLKKKKIGNAAFLVRLAGPSGTVGMNHILRYLSSENKHNLAIRLLNRMKKWGARENEYTYVNLRAKSMSKTANPIKVEKILETYEKSVARASKYDRQTRRIHANQGLTSIAGTGDIRALLDFYRNMTDKDEITYSIMLNALSMTEENTELMHFKSNIWKEVERRAQEDGLKIDNKLVRAYAHAVSKSNIEHSSEKVIEIIRKYFELPEMYDDAHPVDSLTPPFNKLAIGAAELDILMRTLVKFSRHEECIRYFEHYKSQRFELEASHYDSYVKAISHTGNVEAANKLFDEFNSMGPNIESASFKPTSAMCSHLIRAFTICDVKSIDPERIEEIKRLCQKIWGKRLHITLIAAYAATFNYVYSPEVSKANPDIHPRYGLKALNDVALSHQVFAMNLTEGTHVDECREALKATTELCESIYNNPAWKKHRFIWVSKMKEMCAKFSEQISEDQVESRAIEDFELELSTIVKRAKNQQKKIKDKDLENIFLGKGTTTEVLVT